MNRTVLYFVKICTAVYLSLSSTTSFATQIFDFIEIDTGITLATLESEEPDGRYYTTITLTTPWGSSDPSPPLDCADLETFLRPTFVPVLLVRFFGDIEISDGSIESDGKVGLRGASGFPAIVTGTASWGYLFLKFYDTEDDDLIEAYFPNLDASYIVYGDWVERETQPVPEPSTLILLSIGLTTCVGLRRKFRK